MSSHPLTEPVPAAQEVVRFDAFGAPDTLRVLRGLAIPEPGPGEARIRVEASSVQFTDTLIRRGLYPDLRDPPPVVPGYDLVGRVDAVGEGVSEVAIGDRVADLTMIGGNARYAIRPAAGLVPVPETVDAAEAATLVLSWMTAQQVLSRTGGVRAGQRVLVTGGNGAVGLAAIQLAVRAGVEVFAAASPRHHDTLRALGATPVPREGYAAEILDRGGVDLAIDGVGAHGFAEPYRCLRRGGRLVAIGVGAAAAEGSKTAALLAFLQLGLKWLWPDKKRVSFYSITSVRSKHPAWFAEDLAGLFSLLASGEIAPEVAERLALSDVAAAHARLERGGLSGKLVLVF